MFHLFLSIPGMQCYIGSCSQIPGMVLDTGINQAIIFDVMHILTGGLISNLSLLIGQASASRSGSCGKVRNPQQGREYVASPGINQR
jgi:hypothetical protein